MRYLIMVVLTAVMFAGCAASSKSIKVPGVGKDVRVYDKGNGLYTFKWGGKFSIVSKDEEFTGYKRMFQAIAITGLANGYSYAAVVNEKFNNMYGYPINSWKALQSIIDLYDKGHFRAGYLESIDKSNYPTIKVLYLKERPKGLFVWDLKALKSETI